MAELRPDPEALRAPLAAALAEAAGLADPPAGATEAQAARARLRGYLQAMRARLPAGRTAPLDPGEREELRAEASHLAAALLRGVLGAEGAAAATPEAALARLEAEAGLSTAFGIETPVASPEVAGWATEVDVQAGTLALAHGTDLDVATALAAVRAGLALAGALEDVPS